MIGCLRTCVHMQPIIALYFESETVLKFYNLEAWPQGFILRLKIKRNNLAACGHVSASSQSLRFILTQSVLKFYHLEACFTIEES